MYEVQVHDYGRPIVQRGPAAGCPNFPQHRWTRITQRPVGLTRARALADAQDRHAVVGRWMQAGTVYDNGKKPGLPEGWLPDPDPNRQPNPDRCAVCGGLRSVGMHVRCDTSGYEGL